MAMVSLPLILIEPLRAPTSPMMERRVVVRPAPLRPSKVTTSPLFTLRSTLCRICDSPYQDCRLEIASAGVAAVFPAVAAALCNVAVLISGLPPARLQWCPYRLPSPVHLSIPLHRCLRPAQRRVATH